MGILAKLGAKYAKYAKPFAQSTPGLKWVGQTGHNFFTGIRTTKGANAAAIAGLSLYSMGASAKAASDYKNIAKDTNQQQVGILPAMHYAQPTTGRDLGASGDIVFGLNNMRRGR